MTARVAAESKRLRRLFRRALITAAAVTQVAVPFIACSADPPAQTNASSSTAGAGGATSTTTGGGSGDVVGPTTSGAGGSGGGWAPGCEPKSYVPTGDASDDCGNYVHLACGVPAEVTREPDCYLEIGSCRYLCGSLAFNCHAIGESCLDGGTIRSGEVDIDCSICLNGAGRGVEGHEPPRVAAGADLGAYLAACAELEDASVHAFTRFAAELRRHGAGRQLRRAARRAERDERRHAKVVGRLARRFGGSPSTARVADAGAGSLEALAIENVVEGCVRETFGALVATYQGDHARDAEIAAALRRIAEDESRHAALSWAVTRWCAMRLDAASRERVRQAGHAALSQLADRARRGAEPPANADAAGLPSAEVQSALLEAVRGPLCAELDRVLAPPRSAMGRALAAA